MARGFDSDLIAALKGIDRPGSFTAAGTAPAFLPGLEVPGLGPISFPLTTHQAGELKALCERAPFGKGERTLTDTDVRRVWRLKPDRFVLDSPDWAEYLARTVESVRQGLGLEGEELSAELYEMLLYEPGSFFLPHKDGEKAERMVATLVIVLPSNYTGGELLVRHEGEERVIDHSTESPRRLCHAAFYADCEHEIRPVTSGHRLCLVYNLSLAKSKKRITAPSAAAATDAIAAVLTPWAATATDKLVVPLGHQYTEAGVSWDALKGADRPKAQALLAAAGRAGCRAYLALLTLHESGSAEYVGRRTSRRRGSWYEEESGEASDYEMGEVFDESLGLSHWQADDGSAFPLRQMSLETEEVLGGEGALRGITPQTEFEGYTGNAGMTLDHWYRHAAVVIWPERLHFDVLCDAGCRQAADVLADTAERWAKDGRPTDREAAIRGFAEALLRNWTPERSFGEDEERRAALFRALAVIGDAGMIKKYLREILPADANSDPGDHLAPACAAIGWAEVRGELEEAFKATTEATLQRNIRLLEVVCLAKGKKDDALGALRAAAAPPVVAALIEADTRKRAHEWEYDTVRLNRAAILGRLARGLSAAGQDELLTRVVEHALALPKRYPLAESHLAALEKLRPWLEKHGKKLGAGVRNWIDGCRGQLEALTSEEPKLPVDFRRPADVSCTCRECRELAKFLADPAEREHRFRAIQERRSHLESRIRADKCDLDMTTERRGSPHTLVCTKNTASFQAALKKYHEDVKRLADVRSLEALLA